MCIMTNWSMFHYVKASWCICKTLVSDVVKKYRICGVLWYITSWEHPKLAGLSIPLHPWRTSNVNRTLLKPNCTDLHHACYPSVDEKQSQEMKGHDSWMVIYGLYCLWPVRFFNNLHILWHHRHQHSILVDNTIEMSPALVASASEDYPTIQSVPVSDISEELPSSSATSLRRTVILYTYKHWSYVKRPFSHF